jgi:hypothetical protein
VRPVHATVAGTPTAPRGIKVEIDRHARDLDRMRSGIKLGVRLAAWIAAMRATPSTSPFFAEPRATMRNVEAFMRMPRRDATRAVSSFAPTSTMCAHGRAGRNESVCAICAPSVPPGTRRGRKVS